MANVTISSLPATTEIASSNVLVVDNGTTTSKIAASDAGSELFRLGAPIKVSKNNVESSGSITLTFGQYTQALIVLTGYGSSTQNLLVATSAASVLRALEFGSSTQMTTSISGLELTVSNSSGYNAFADIIIFRGSITVS